MSDDRLERALQEMTAEDVDSGTLQAARARVWDKLTTADRATCAEFQQDFAALLSGQLGGSRRLLVDDHLSRCPACRSRIAGMKGERTAIGMPQRSSSQWTRWGAMAAAAAVLVAALYLGGDSIDAIMGPRGARATVVSAEGGLYRLAGLSAEAPSGRAEGARTSAGSSRFPLRSQ